MDALFAVLLNHDLKENKRKFKFIFQKKMLLYSKITRGYILPKWLGKFLYLLRNSVIRVNKILSEKMESHDMSLKYNMN
jgi:hypothetical protein